MKRRIFVVFLVSIMILCTLVSCVGESKKLKTVDIKLTSEQYAFGVNKDDTSLLNSTNELLEEIKNDGTLETIVNKYFINDTSKIKTFDGGEYAPCKDQLVVATNVPFEPFEYKIGDRYCGIDIEIAGLLAEKTGKELVILEYSFEDIFTEIQNGKVDIIMSGLSVSPDREEYVNFTDTYFEASQVIVAKSKDKTFDECKTKEEVTDVLKKMNSNTKIGYQKNTTSQYFVCGNEKIGFKGFDTNNVGYESAYKAIKALQNGEVDYVIVDKDPAGVIINSLNDEK